MIQEVVHDILDRGMRANQSGAPDIPGNFWPFSRSYAATQHMVTINTRRGMSPTKGLTGRDASLHAMMPWGSHIAVLSMPRPNRVRPRAVTARGVQRVGTYLSSSR